MDREQYLRRLQADLDRWNAQITAWEETLREAPDDLRAKLQAHLAGWREQRDLAALALCEVQLASGEALDEVLRGADAAWRDLAHAYELARQRFAAHASDGAANDGGARSDRAEEAQRARKRSPRR